MVVLENDGSTIKYTQHVLLQLGRTQTAKVSFFITSCTLKYPSILSLVFEVTGCGHVLLLRLATLLLGLFLAIFEVLLVVAPNWVLHFNEDVVTESINPYFLCLIGALLFSTVLVL